MDAEKAPSVFDVVDPAFSSAAEKDLLSSSPSPPLGWLERLTRFLRTWGVETHGIEPVPQIARTDTRTYQLFFLWFSTNLSVLTVSTGVSGPAFFSLGQRDAFLIILVVDLLYVPAPAPDAVFGPQLGMRAMVQSRFSWGYYAAALPAALNVFSLQGFLILDTIIGGQTLAAVSPSRLNATAGIVIIAVLSLVLTFCGYRVLHWYEQFAWVPNAVAFITLLAVGARDMRTAPAPSAPPTASAVLSFASIVCISVFSWCTMSPDYGVHHAPAPPRRVILFVYLGFLLGSLPGHMIGAALASAAPVVPDWAAGLGPDSSDVGGLVGAVLARAGGFGRFLTALIALTIPSGVAPTMYSFGTSLMAVTPLAARVPRYVWGVVATAVLIPVGIVGAVRFYNTFVDILSVIGYWSAPFAGIVLADHFVIRRGRWASYEPADWDRPRVLPLGAAAFGAWLFSVGIIVPCMNQVYYVGPIAAAGAGDIAIYTSVVLAVIMYIPARLLEMRFERRIGQGGAVH
ncbi:permease for cytosine/purines, uracil, thiamine, allantoin-domain-containing protein [Vararia minispora EC-137]|uniref:Permease for cytosine/purines, uracil, thiamine, allantoin-domain-containing protein n=1 Tax=Vararia minispora EC-137 TaxID=1314806 RepID=A0ACB8QB30_9AGAM|nr:permease for cytosine/purines, uracil, thiamine, allantoin-domain-containing protein [Vararia minispora EC-137]